MVTVEADVDGVEQRLRSGGLICPGCDGTLAGWGHGSARVLRGPAGPLRLRPRRSRCTGCGVTHVLLPVVALLRRADTAQVIGRALVARARGAGFRRIAAELGRPAETVRGWLRRFAGRAERVRVVFTGLLRALEPDPVMPGPAGSEQANAVTAVLAASRAAAGRFALGTVAPWELAVAISTGCLLAPGWPTKSINTS